MPLIDRHILWEWLKIFAMALIAMVGMLLISAIYNNLEDLLEWELSTGTAIEFFCDDHARFFADCDSRVAVGVVAFFLGAFA